MIKRFPIIPMVVQVNADTNKFFPGTSWGSTDEVELISDALETLNMPAAAAMTVTIGMQLCNVPDSPDTAVALTSARTGDGLTFPVAPVDKSSSTAARQLVRFGYLAKNTGAADTTVRFAWVTGMVQSQKKG